MPTHTLSPNKSTRTDLGPSPEEQQRIQDEIKRQACVAEGGTWNAETRQCEFTEVEQIARQIGEQQRAKEAAEAPLPPRDPKDLPETSNPLLERARELGVPLETFRETGEGRKAFTARAQLDATGQELQSSVAGEELQARSQQLSEQVGQVGPQATLEPTPLDFGQGISQGLLSAVPRALSAAGGLVLAGEAIGVGGAAGKAGAAAAAKGVGGILGRINPYVAAATFAATLASSITSELRGQRVDNINAQKRVLDEGKQVLNDLATLAATDPANRVTYLRQYNQVLGRIDQAYRQMLLDTNNDLAKFESAIPDIAEFEEFYDGGERETINAKMRNSLLTPSNSEYEMLELINRRTD